MPLELEMDVEKKMNIGRFNLDHDHNHTIIAERELCFYGQKVVLNGSDVTELPKLFEQVKSLESSLSKRLQDIEDYLNHIKGFVELQTQIKN